MGKVVSLEDLAIIIADTKTKGKKVVLCPGVFDVFHVGHKRHLEKAKSFGDVLVVTITADKDIDKPDRPIFRQELRTELVASLEFVDYVAINNWKTNEETVRLLKPSVLVRGLEYSKSDDVRVIGENKAAKEVNCGLLFTDELMCSSTLLDIRESLPLQTRQYLSTFKYSVDDIVGHIEKIKKLKILVIGERYVDKYQFGHMDSSMFVEDKLETYEGGSLAVYNHLKSFTELVDVHYNLIVHKTSYIDNEYNSFNSYKIDNETTRDINYNIKQYDLVVVVDYGHGMFTGELIDFLKYNANFLVVNAKKRLFSSIRKYGNMTDNMFMCLNEDELRTAVYEKYDKNCSVVDIIKNGFGDNKIIVTTGYKGCVAGGIEIPSFVTKVSDTIGCGDSFLSLAAPLVYLNTPLEVVGFVGNIAGAIMCGCPGNKISVTKDRVYDMLYNLIGKEGQWKYKN